MSYRPLVLVGGLTLGDYLLWHWSLNSNHDAIALISGVTLPPLAVALVWILALGVMRALVGRGRAPAPRRSAGRRHRGAAEPVVHTAGQSPAPGQASRRELEHAVAASGRSSGKIAA